MDILMRYLKTEKTLSIKRITLILCGISLLFSLLFSYFSYRLITGSEVNSILSQLPTIEINNGIVESPVDTLIELTPPTHHVHFIINTKVSDLSDPKNNTIVLTKNALYATMQNQTQKVDLPKEKITVNKDFLIKMFKISIAELGVFSFILLSVIFMIGYYGTYWLSYLLLKVFRKEIDKDTLKKSSFIGWVSIIILNTILLMTGHGFSALNAMFLASFISVFCLFRIKD